MMVKCIVSICTGEGTKTITDAKHYPEEYNGKLLCEEHYNVREYMKDDGSGQMRVKCIPCDVTFESSSLEAREHIKHDWNFYPDGEKI